MVKKKKLNVKRDYWLYLSIFAIVVVICAFILFADKWRFTSDSEEIAGQAINVKNNMLISNKLNVPEKKLDCDSITLTSEWKNSNGKTPKEVCSERGKLHVQSIEALYRSQNANVYAYTIEKIRFVTEETIININPTEYSQKNEYLITCCNIVDFVTAPEKSYEQPNTKGNPNKDPYCLDSDGKDVYTKGIVKYDFLVNDPKKQKIVDKVDECIDETTLREYWCDSETNTLKWEDKGCGVVGCGEGKCHWSTK